MATSNCVLMSYCSLTQLPEFASTEGEVTQSYLTARMVPNVDPDGDQTVAYAFPLAEVQSESYSPTSVLNLTPLLVLGKLTTILMQDTVSGTHHSIEAGQQDKSVGYEFGKDFTNPKEYSFPPLNTLETSSVCEQDVAGNYICTSPKNLDPGCDIISGKKDVKATEIMAGCATPNEARFEESGPTNPKADKLKSGDSTPKRYYAAGYDCIAAASDDSKVSGHEHVIKVGALTGSKDTTCFVSKDEPSKSVCDEVVNTDQQHNSGSTIVGECYNKTADARLMIIDKTVDESHAVTNCNENFDVANQNEINLSPTTPDLKVCGLKQQTCQSVGTCGSTVKLLGETTEILTIVLPCEGSLTSEHPTLLYGVCKGSVDIVSKIVDVGHSICCPADAL